MTTIGEFLLRRLKEAGIRHIFGVPGDFNLEFLEQIESDPALQWVGNCNELNAAYAADGYARSAGAAALLTTYGVGELSAVAGVAGAYSERVPMVVITGAPPLSSMQRRALLHHTLADGNYDNMMICMRQFAVAHTCLTPQNAVIEIDRCLRACLIEKRPVYLQLPSDVAMLQTEAPQESLNLVFRSDEEMLTEFATRVLTRLRAARRPAFLVDADVDRFGLRELLQDLMKASKVPAALLSTAKGVLSDLDPLCLGLYSGGVSRPNVRAAIEDSDCLITLGVRLTDATTGAFSASIPAAREVMVNDWFGRIDGEDFYGISMGDVLRRLLKELQQIPLGHVYTAKEPGTPSQVEGDPDASLVHANFWPRVGTMLRENDVVLADNGTPLSGLMGVPLPAEVRVISQPIWGAIGYTLPATLGSCLASPRQRHILLIGDGSFQVTAQELSTIFRYDAQPIIFLLNNDGYTIERLILGENAAYNDIQNWHYREICGVFAQKDEFTTYRVETVSQLDAAINAAENSRQCVFIEVILPRMDGPPLLKKLGPVFARLDYGIKWEMAGCPGGRLPGSS